MKKIEPKFIILMAYLMSLAALAIDAMMPALGDIQKSLEIQNDNNVQLVISIVFLGMSFGLMLYGPLSDAHGRKKPLYLGLGIFIIGSFVSYFSQSLEVMLFGRFLQGFGTASARVISVAMIRDCYAGAEMAKIMSLIMVIFIIVPALAPTLGQLILYISTWESIFSFLVFMGVVGILALRFYQEETLAKENRIPFSMESLIKGVKETIKNPVSRGYTIASGLIFGAFVGYLSLAQQILQIQYKLGDKFSFYFGVLALFIGFSSFLNSKFVEKYGMKKLTNIALLSLALLSGALLFVSLFLSGGVPIYLFLAYLGLSFLFIGILFGNLNSLAIEPLGHIAGTANSVISSLQTFLSVGIAAIVGQSYSGTVYPLVIAFFVLSLASFVSIKLSLREKIFVL